MASYVVLLNLLPSFLLYTINYPLCLSLFAKFENTYSEKPEDFLFFIFFTPVVTHRRVQRIDWDRKSPLAGRHLLETGCPSEPWVKMLLPASAFTSFIKGGGRIGGFDVGSLQGGTVALATGAARCGFTGAIWIWSRCPQ